MSVTSPDINASSPRAPAFARTDQEPPSGRAPAIPPSAEASAIKDFDKTGIYQQIIQAESAVEIQDLERRIELIEAIQKVPLLQTLPQTALYFLERELKVTQHETGEIIKTISLEQDKVSTMHVMVQGQAMVMGLDKKTSKSHVINILKMT